MNFTPNEEQVAFSDVATQFARDEFEPYANQWDEECIFPVKSLQKAAKLGFGGMFVRGDVGGTELKRLDATFIFEELAKGCTSTTAYISIHNMVAWMIDEFGTDEQRHQFLPKLVSMEHLSSYCLTEPSSGSDAASLRTRAELDGDTYVLNGSKSFISGAGVSDIYLCMVRTGGDGLDGISCIIVEKDTAGLSFGAQEKKLGWRSQPAAQVNFDNCRIPKSNLIGQEGQGFRIAMAGLDGGRLNIGACSIGAAQSCIERTLVYLKDRKQFGVPLSEFQALQFKLADMQTEIEAARLLLQKAAMKVDEKSHDATMYSAMAKRLATDTGFEVINQALQMHGGYGCLKDYPIERYLRDVRVHQIIEGTNEIMRHIISRKLLND